MQSGAIGASIGWARAKLDNNKTVSTPQIHLIWTPGSRFLAAAGPLHPSRTSDEPPPRHSPGPLHPTQAFSFHAPVFMKVHKLE
jgi:hypothetical protein